MTLQDELNPTPLPLQPSVPPTTTIQQDITLKGQRKINLIWEYTQAMIAIVVILFTLSVSAYGYVVRDSVEIPNILAATCGTIIGFYFARTNHQAIGGIGPKANENQEYDGR